MTLSAGCEEQACEVLLRLLHRSSMKAVDYTRLRGKMSTEKFLKLRIN